MSKEHMIVVIVCAAGKDPSAGHMLTENGQRVMFVADPKKAPPHKSIIYKRPDDLAHSGLSWREELNKYNRKYNRDPLNNPLRLLPAWRLYEPRPPYRNIYRKLVKVFGTKNVFILSAGWGLISACFLTPDYDITFSPEAAKKKPCARRRKQDENLYEDSAMLPEDTRKPIVFLGGKSYVPFFCSLTEGAKSRRIVFYKSKVPRSAPGCVLYRFITETRIWYYECAKELVLGKIEIACA